MKVRAIAAAALTAALAACSAASPTTATVQVGDALTFSVEVADTEQTQRDGLSGRTSLSEGTGMLFPFDPPKIATFWMKNTLIPLDMIFIRADGTIDRIAENTVPESLAPVASGGEVKAVLELAGGTAATLGLDESATVTWTDNGAKRP